MSKLDELKKELQGLVDKGKITAKEYQDKIDEAIYGDGGYENKDDGMKKKTYYLSTRGTCNRVFNWKNSKINIL